MIETLKKYLKDLFDDNVYEDKDRALQLACTIIMFEVLRADTKTHPDEVNKIRHHIIRAFDLNEEEAEKLMQQAKHEVDHATSLHEVVRAINGIYQPEDKRNLIRMLWDVAYADGELDKYEEYTIRKLADWLYVPHRDFIRMKHERGTTA